VDAWVNLGDYGVELCEPDPRAELPDIRFTCEMNAHDASARVDLVAVPRQRFLTERVATLLLHRDDEASLAYHAPPELPSSETNGDVAAQVTAALLAARTEAGQDTDGVLSVSAAESTRHGPLLDALTALGTSGDASTIERLELGMLAGWSVGAAPVGATLFIGEGDGGDARRFIRDQLTMPTARHALLTSMADVVAVAAHETDRGLRASITFFRTWNAAELESYRRAWTEHINAERQRAGVSPLLILDDVQDLQQEADKVTRDGAHPQEVLTDAMARLRGRLGRTVRCWSVHAYDPRWVEIPGEFHDSGDVNAVVGISYLRPDGAAWGQLVLFLCVFPE
jgi:hypothetical protein